MSFTHTPLKRTRLNRSELFIPGSKPDLFPKAVNSNADVICIDLEDAVAPQDKDEAKKNLIQALKELDFGKKTVSMRINGLDTNFCYRDVVDVMENGGERLDLMMIPKVGVPADVIEARKRGRMFDGKDHDRRISFVKEYIRKLLELPEG